MMKFIITTLLFFAFIIGKNDALDIDNYTAFINELMEDEQFVDEYTKWSFQLFSQPDYIYGDTPRTFPCPITKDPNVATSVHALRPSDIKCTGAMGDSLTAALGAHAITPLGLFYEIRGVSWAVGGDHSFSKVASVPNVLRQYDTQLQGYSTKSSCIFLKGQDAKNNHMNVAESGDVSEQMPFQANVLVNRTIKEGFCDWENDWKMVTLFIGGNDLCSFCEDPNVGKYTPAQYMTNVRDALDILHATMPRTIVNLVSVLDVRMVKDLNSGGFVCQTLHKRTCPCAAFPTEDQAKLLNEYVPAYQSALVDLVSSGRYDTRDDFTVVNQPFFTQTQLPRKPDHTIDFSYFAPDCFHFSGKGHAQAALSLWNNMFEPVGAKQPAWHMGEDYKCPSDQYPYIFTNKNSPKDLEAYRRSIRAQSTTNIPSVSTTGIPSVSTTGIPSVSTTGIPSVSTTSIPPVSTSSIRPAVSTTEGHKHKHHKSHSEQFTKMQFAMYAGLFFLMMILLIVVVTRRQQIRVFVHGAGRRHLDGFTNPQYPADDDEIEVWKRSSMPQGSLIKNDIPKTHGTRIDFE